MKFKNKIVFVFFVFLIINSQIFFGEDFENKSQPLLNGTLVEENHKEIEMNNSVSNNKISKLASSEKMENSSEIKDSSSCEKLSFAEREESSPDEKISSEKLECSPETKDSASCEKFSSAEREKSSTDEKISSEKLRYSTETKDNTSNVRIFSDAKKDSFEKEKILEKKIFSKEEDLIINDLIINKEPILEKIPVVAVFMVKDEAHVIKETLEPYIRGGIKNFFIYDTGSTDETVKYAKEYFEENGIVNFGIVKEYFVKKFGFKNFHFAMARNRGLDFAREKFPNATFVLMPDAEWHLHNVEGLIEFCKQHELENAVKSYGIAILSGHDFDTPRLIRNDRVAHFEGRIHEVILPVTIEKVPKNIYFELKTTEKGAEKSKKRWERDKEILLEEFSQNPTSRNCFYLAQTYASLEDYENAYKYYKIRSEMIGWPEEDYMSVYRLAQCVEELRRKNSNFSWEMAEELYLRAHKMRPTRAEPLVRIAMHYFRGMTEEEEKRFLLKDRMQLSYNYATWSMKIPYPVTDVLFKEKYLYEIDRYNIAAPAASYIGMCEEGKLFAAYLLKKDPNSSTFKMNFDYYQSGKCIPDNSLEKFELKNFVIENKNSYEQKNYDQEKNQLEENSKNFKGKNEQEKSVLAEKELLESKQKSPTTVFELAKNFEESENYEKAYNYYKIRSEMVGETEENFMTLYRLAKVIEKLSLKNSNYKWFEAEETYLNAYKMRPSRAEPVIKIAQHYFYGANKNSSNFKNYMQKAFYFASEAMKISEPKGDKLFDIRDNLLSDNSRYFIGKYFYDIERYYIAGMSAYHIGKCKEGEKIIRFLFSNWPYQPRLRSIFNLYINGSCKEEDYLQNVTKFLENKNKDEEWPFVIIVNGYNNKNSYKNFLNKIFDQNYKNYRVVYIDNGSTDGSDELIKLYLSEKTNVTFINSKQSYLENIYEIINNKCKSNEIVLLLDEKNDFVEANLLKNLNHEYQDPNIWMIYESLDQNFRELNFKFLLKSFYAGLFQKIKKEDLQYNGKFLNCFIDQAIMFPILEMSKNHSKIFIDFNPKSFNEIASENVKNYKEILEEPLLESKLIKKKVDAQENEKEDSKNFKEEYNLIKYYFRALKEYAPINNPVEEKAFVVVIPSYNNKNWYKFNLNSALNQNYSNYRIIYIDDASPDDTGKLVENYIKEKNQENKVTLIKNVKRIGAMANIYNGVYNCKSDEIVVLLDGDDWFYDNNVLSFLNLVYQNPNVWMTYGQFMHWKGGDVGWAAEYPEKDLKENKYRDNPWLLAMPTRSFYAGLFKKIKKEDLSYNGDFIKFFSDCAYEWAMLEMSGEHTKFISRVSYIYNIENSSNDFKKHDSEKAGLEKYLRAIKKYERLNNLFD